uniref:Zasp-like motif domain-containing protein n=1 Tax=Bactrocera oleae TaxID=104688 RepID=E5L9G8_BACOL|nr:hypothetical protein [Bactrocera oleae]
MVSQWQLINNNYKNMDGYKRVAWPPVSEERVVREFTPQPTSAHYPVSGSLPQQPGQQQQPLQQQQQQQHTAPANQPQHVGLDQPDHQATVQQHQAQNLPQVYRGGSPGIITLRKEAPVTQKPTPVYNAQPAAVSFQGGSNMRGDLKWPPPEYKEAAIRENEERRKLAQGPVCRPRKVNRDYTTFFAKTR